MNAMETDRLTGTYEVLSSNWEYAEAKLSKLIRKAARLGVDALSYKVIGREMRARQGGYTWDGKPRTVQYAVVIVELTGIAPHVAGWTFAATIQHAPTGNIIRRTPGLPESIEAPLYFRTAPQSCDHCQTHRRRNDTFLVVDGAGEWKQVGRNCLADFLGGRDPHILLESLELFSQADALLSVGDGDEFGGGGSGRCYTFPAESFLSATATFIRLEGWLSRKAAREAIGGANATADRVLWFLSPSFSERERAAKDTILQTEQDEETGAAALQWVRAELGGKDFARRTEYEHNLVVALAGDDITQREAGIAASAVYCYLRAQEREVARRKNLEGRLNEWFGAVEEDRTITKGKNAGQVKKVKPRYELTLTVEKVFSTESNWGVSHITKLVDSEGRSFTWFAGQMLHPGDVVKATWSVKKHEEYKGWKQTILTRPTGLVVEGGAP